MSASEIDFASSFSALVLAAQSLPSRQKGRGEGMDTEKNKEAPRDGTSCNLDGIRDALYFDKDEFVRKWNAIAESEYRARRRWYWSNLRGTLVTMIGKLSVITLFIYIWVCLLRWVI